jgi:hypothetical protein
LIAKVPQLSKDSALVARCKKAAEGYAKRAPAGSRDPPPEEVVYAVVGCLIAMNKPLEALNELIRFLCGARPGEIDHLTVDQFIKPTQPDGFWSILYNLIENLRPGKTGEWDEGVIIDQPHVQCLSPIFHQMVVNRSAGGNLWKRTPQQLNVAFNLALERLGLTHLNIVRYSWRHAAASADLLTKSRTAEEVKARFRWRSDSSMKRYTKAARVEYFRKQFPPDVLSYGHIIKTQLLNIFQGHVIQPPVK